MRILVTGGTGYIGKYLIPKLVGPHKIFVLSRKKIAHNQKLFTTIVADLKNKDQLEKKILHSRFDLIIHLGAYIPKNPNEFEEESFRTNFFGTQNIVSIAQKCRVRQIIFASTFSIYGKGSVQEIVETCIPNPVNFYALSKYFAEEYLLKFYNRYGIDTTILRIAGVFGGDRKDGVIHNFLANALSHKIIDVFNPFNATDMVHVDDVADAIVKSFGLAGFNIINIGCGERNRVIELAYLVKKLSGSDSKIRIHSQDPHDALSLVLNTDRAKSLIGFKPKRMQDSIYELINF